MCGRYAFYPDESFGERFKLSEFGELPRNYNVTPGSAMPVIVGREIREVMKMGWGLVPSWADEKIMKQGFVNARAETLSEKPAFRNAFAWRRCIVPANGFYEWKERGGKKIPYYITSRSGEMLGLAGIFEARRNGSGSEDKNFAIITKAAEQKLQEIHDRMPVIIGREQEKLWLGEDNITEELENILCLDVGDELEFFQVGERVNRVDENDPELIERA